MLKEIKDHYEVKSDADFARLLGISTQNIYTWIKRRTYDPVVILAKCPEISADWLITGNGAMLKDCNKESAVGGMDANGYRMVPVYNFDVVGGMDAWAVVVDSPVYIEKYVPFSGAAKDDICVHVTGNSMVPTYSAGSLLLIRKVEGWREYFGYGHCYVLLLKDGRRILKEVRKSEVNPKTHVLCVSFNPKNDPEELSRDFIVDVYKVIMTLTNDGF